MFLWRNKKIIYTFLEKKEVSYLELWHKLSGTNAARIRLLLQQVFKHFCFYIKNESATHYTNQNQFQSTNSLHTTWIMITLLINVWPWLEKTRPSPLTHVTTWSWMTAKMMTLLLYKWSRHSITNVSHCLVLDDNKDYDHTSGSTDYGLVECCAVVKHLIQDQELVCSTPVSTQCWVLEQDTLSTMLSTGFYPGRPACNTVKPV